ncbi:MAG TPA: hypothetical protein VGU24_15020 [Microvirga sp.]|jgi:hypothetical protein|nr:hypothetical protein [Microvirga sp.]
MSAGSRRDDDETVLSLATHPAPLHGTLTRALVTPENATAVLILAGSDPVDRDGNLPSTRNDSLKLLLKVLRVGA